MGDQNKIHLLGIHELLLIPYAGVIQFILLKTDNQMLSVPI